MRNFKNIADIQAYLLEITGLKFHIEKRRRQLFFYYPKGNEVCWDAIYNDIKYLTEKQLKKMVAKMHGEEIPYYE